MVTIPYVDVTWNPVTGCSKISPACDNCYAERLAKRLAGRGGYPKQNPFAVTLHPEKLEMPKHWRKPRRVFVCSMGDLFHPDVPGKYINEVWMQMFNNPKHTYLVLTKRPDMMLLWTKVAASHKGWPIADIWPDHIWLGVTAENQDQADRRLPFLFQVPAKHKWVSVEPMLGVISLRPYLDKLDWVVCGGETGPMSRATDSDWVRQLRDDCSEVKVPFYFKGWGDWCPEVEISDDVPDAEGAPVKNWLLKYEASYKIGKKWSGNTLDGKIHEELGREKEKNNEVPTGHEK